MLDIVLVAVAIMGQQSDDTKLGTFEVVWEPKECMMAPCPQFRVLSVDGKEVKEKGADIFVNNRAIDFAQSTMKGFKSIFVTGKYKAVDNEMNFEIYQPEMRARLNDRLSIIENYEGPRPKKVIR